MTRLLVILATAAVSAVLQAPVLWAWQPEQQNEFIPIDQLPPQDQLPAAPLLVAAYAIVVIALFVYVMSVARRLTSVQRELERLESDMKRGTRA